MLSGTEDGEDTPVNRQLHAASLLLETMRSTDLQDVASMAADAITEDVLAQVLGHVPLAGMLVALARAGGAIRDHMFGRKILSFLRPLATVAPERRMKMIQQLEADPSFGEKVGEHLLLLLDRLDSFEKASMMGRAFKAYIEGRIDGAMLYRLNYVIDRLVMSDVPFVREFAENPDGARISDAARQGLVNAGLAHVPPRLANPHVWPVPDVCDAFVDHVLDNPSGIPRKPWRAPWPP